MSCSTTWEAADSPILTAHLFPKLRTNLVELLRSLERDDWNRQTLAPKWKVRHVAAHLLDTQLRKLTVVRDGVSYEPPASAAPGDVLAFVNRLNAEGVNVYGRFSPALLIALLEQVGAEFCEYVASLDPMKPAAFAVSWAGESRSLNWFDTARELTEHWHHQQQIHLATGRDGIMTPELYHPVLETFMRALPFTYRNVIAPERTCVRVTVQGDCGHPWWLVRGHSAWKLTTSPHDRETAGIQVPQDIAWRIFTKGIDKEAAQAIAVIDGDKHLADHFFTTLAIVG